MSGQQAAGVSVTCAFVRGRNSLVTRARFTDLYVDYYLHLMQHGIRPAQEVDTMLKDALAALVLHLMSRPPDESVAWTIHTSHPKLNLFVTGSAGTGNVTGRVFSEDVKETGENLFFARSVRRNADPHQSVVGFTGTDMVAAAETFYRQSQQVPVRFLRMPDAEAFALVTGMPDGDIAWLESLDAAAVEQLDQTESVRHLQTRSYRFACECTLERIFGAISTLADADVEDLFEGTEKILRIHCPRCGALHEATRGDIASARGEPSGR